MILRGIIRCGDKGFELHFTDEANTPLVEPIGPFRSLHEAELALQDFVAMMKDFAARNPPGGEPQ